jgi:FMN-dependent NADH-azoreductase
MLDQTHSTHLLHLDSAAPGSASISRMLGRELVTGWAQRDRSAVLTYRDLVEEPLEVVSSAWVSAAFAAPEQRTADSAFALTRSDALIAELEAADVLVIGAPMYNFGIPASLKAWVDQVVRVGRTFVYEGPRPVGTVHGKRAIILATSGGDANYYASVGLDFRTSYLRAILGFIGITEVEVLTVIDTMTGADLDTARAELDALLDRQVAAGRARTTVAADAG